MIWVRCTLLLAARLAISMAEEPWIIIGNPACWQDGYTYEDCCGKPPKWNCWDLEFTEEKCCKYLEEFSDGPIDTRNEDLDVAHSRIAMFVKQRPLECEDDPPGLWLLLKESVINLNVSRTYGMPGHRPNEVVMQNIAEHVKSWVRDEQAWQKVQKACPVGVLNAIDLVVKKLDKEDSEELAVEAYRLHQQLAPTVLSGKPSKYWPLLLPSQEHVPKLLGLTGDHNCHGMNLKIYVYKIAKYAHMTQPVLTCSQKMGQCTASVHIHRWFESGSCLTADPDQADLFYFPAYEACYNETACGLDNNTERCYPSTFDPYLDLPHFSRRRGADHFFVFGCNLPPFSDSLMIAMRNSIIATVESYQARMRSGPEMFAWMSEWKDVVIPGYIPAWRISAMLAFNRPVLKRAQLVAFHGHYARSRDVGFMYDRSPLADIRTKVINYFWNASGCSAGPPVRDYFRRMGASKFCLIPAGLTAWTIHLYEAFFLGCIPVILSDELTPPFQREIDWPSLSIKVSTNMSMPDLHTMLAKYRVGRMKKMHAALAKARCWLDYSRGWHRNDEDQCSPYKALMSALEIRANRNNALHGLSRFWAPPFEGEVS